MFCRYCSKDIIGEPVMAKAHPGRKNKRRVPMHAACEKRRKGVFKRTTWNAKRPVTGSVETGKKR